MQDLQRQVFGKAWRGWKELGRKREGKEVKVKVVRAKAWKWGFIYKQKITLAQGYWEGTFALAFAKPDHGQPIGQEYG